MPGERHTYRFFARDVRDGVAALSHADRHHLARVLRLGVGDTCEVVWQGRVHRARVTPEGCELLEEVEDVAKAPSVTVWLAQPGARSDEAVEKLTELGVAAIGALQTDLLKGSFSASRLERWSRVAESAAKQAKRAELPELLGPSPYGEVLSRQAVVLSNTGTSGGLADRIVGRRSATLLIGPEPGFSGAELELARSRGVAVATFGPVVLRTETAAIVAAALALREMGFLG
jgi:16S rRNA (uracil1498-N3)-methyltransferase